MGLITTDTSIKKAKQAKIDILGQKTPKFIEYRSRNHAGMVPDKGFVKQLKKLDKDFEVTWDWASEKWEIWNFPKELGKDPYHVTTVQTKNKTYRELGADILLNLQWGRPGRFTLKELVNYFDEMDNQNRRRKAKDFKAKIEDITRETKTFVNTQFVQVPRSMNVRRVITNA